MSLIPNNAKFSVLGIGVAVSVRTSTFSFFAFKFSFAFTPNYCSSSIISIPKLLKFTSLLSNLCVPITKSIVPFSNFLSISDVFPSVSLDKFYIVIG